MTEAPIEDMHETSDAPDGMPEAQIAQDMPQEPVDMGDEIAPETPEATCPERPADIPEKFWDVETGTLRGDALLKSYRELERKLGAMLPLPEGEQDEVARARLSRALGMPETADDYAIEPRHPMVSPDDELNRRLHDAGFTQSQAQLVYDLAAERFLPLIDEAVGEVARDRELERLAERFGGSERFTETARQIRVWGEANLSPEIYEALSASHDGVLMMHRMMQAEEPHLLAHGTAHEQPSDESTLRAMMRDPRYWRDREPAFVARVTEGFRRLYPD